MHALKVSNLKQEVKEKMKKDRTSVEEIMEQQKKVENYSIHKDCSVVGVEIARRPKYQLFASILYLVNFWLRKIERRTELFMDHERIGDDISEEAERDYDQILDIIVTSLQDNYGDDEYNAALDMVQLQRANESEFEKMMREKTELEERMREGLRQKIDEEHRKARTSMTIDQLLKT